MAQARQPRMPIVLVVDDNDDVRENVVECLEARGFGCWSAASADEALRVLSREGTDPDAVLTDLTMPGLPLERFLEALAARPRSAAVPVLVMTGACERDLPAWLAPERLLAKPFTVPQLLESVAGALAGRRQPAAA